MTFQPITQIKPVEDPFKDLQDNTDTDAAFNENLAAALAGFSGAEAENKTAWFNEIMDSMLTGDWTEVDEPFLLSRGMNPVAAFQQKELPPLIPLIGNLLNEKEHMAIYAPPGVGKSMVSLFLSVLMASKPAKVNQIDNGDGFHKVVYLDGENSPQDAQGRFTNICDMMDIEPSSLTNLIYYNSESEGAELHLTNEDHRKQLLKYIRSEGVKLVVIDNYRTLFGGQENNADVMDEFNRYLDKIKSAGASTIVLHHTNKAYDKEGWPVYSGSGNFLRPYWVAMPLRVKKGEGYTKHNKKLVLEFLLDKDRSATTGMEVRETIATITMCEKDGISWTVTGKEPAQFSEEDALVIKRLQTWLPSVLQEGYEIPDTANKNAIWTDACGPYHNKKGYRDQASKVLPKLVKELQAKHREIENCSPAFQRV